MDKKEIENIASGLFRYAKELDFAGWDPYDGLNSRLFETTPLYNFEKECKS